MANSLARNASCHSLAIVKHDSERLDTSILSVDEETGEHNSHGRYTARR